MFEILEQVVKEGQKKNYFFLHEVLQYVSTQDSSRKIKEDNLKIEENPYLNSELEEEIVTEEKELGLTPLRYSHLPEFPMSECSYHPQPQESIYGNLAALYADPEAEADPHADNPGQEPSKDEEAIEALQESKYEFLDPGADLNYEEKKKLAWWIQFNPALFTFLESFYNLSREVNYKVAA